MFHSIINVNNIVEYEKYISCISYILTLQTLATRSNSLLPDEYIFDCSESVREHYFITEFYTVVVV